MTKTMTQTIEGLTNAQLHHARKAKALKLVDLLEAEYPALSIVPSMSEDESKVAGWDSFHTDDEEVTMIYAGPDLPELADLLDACIEQELDPTGGVEDEGPRISGSVVPEKYRVAYREASTTGQSCGDWLAEWLAEMTLDGDNKLDVDAFTMLMMANGADMDAKWAQLRFTMGKGWQGRFRMNGRQVLEKLVAKTGKVWDHAKREVEPPADFVDAMRAKHAKWLAKEAKREKAAEAVADASVGA